MNNYFYNDKFLPWFLENLLDELLIEAGLNFQEGHRPESEMFELLQVKGFVTREWFGPFLLGPRRQTIRGRC